MKFAAHLSAHITPEWGKQYIQYEAMKDMIYEAQEKAPSPEVTDSSTIQRYFAGFAEKFFQYCEKELSKINTFFLEKLSEANRKYASLKAELQSYLDHQSHHKHAQLRRRRTTITKRGGAVASLRKLHDLKLAFSEFYLSLVLLQNYQSLNFTGFRKILKKHDKIFVTTVGAEWRQAHVETAAFYTNKEVNQLIKDTEQCVTSELEGGDRSKAMKRLRVPPLGDEQHPWTNFKMGLFMGMFAVLVVVIIISCAVDPRPANSKSEKKDSGSGQDEYWVPALQMYRGMLLIIFDLMLLGVNTYGWRSSGVNHVLIFEIDPRNHLSHGQLLELAFFLGVLWSSSVLGYLYSEAIGIPPMTMPLSLAVFLLIALINPFKFFYHKARMWLLRILAFIVTAPFHHVGFADFWLADQLNSLSTVLLDFQYMICYYSFEVSWWGESTPGVCNKNIYGVRAVISCLPAWFRFAQCLRRYRDTKIIFPHIVNAGKYSTTFFVVLFSTLYHIQIELYGDSFRQNSVFFYLWIGAAVVNSCYTYAWDIKMDWGLMDRKAGENRFLREEVVYAYKAYYYFAMVEDLILRFVWTVTMTVGEGLMYNGHILKTIFSFLEVFRRFIWNFFRLENEHLNNCGQFRAVRDISIVPNNANYEQQLIDLMDDTDETRDWRLNDKRSRYTRSNKENRLFVDDDEERLPLVNGSKQLKRL